MFTASDDGFALGIAAGWRAARLFDGNWMLELDLTSSGSSDGELGASTVSRRVLRILTNAARE